MVVAVVLVVVVVVVVVIVEVVDVVLPAKDGSRSAIGARLL